MIFSHAAQDPLDSVQRELILKATATLITIIAVSSKDLELLCEGPEWLPGPDVSLCGR